VVAGNVDARRNGPVRHRELQELVRELQWLRTHNLQFKDGDPQQDILLFAEGAMVLLVLERFLRVILGADATERDTLISLLEKSTSERLGLLTLPHRDRATTIWQLGDVRNTLLHGNYEQAAAGARRASVAEYFKSGVYASQLGLSTPCGFPVRCCARSVPRRARCLS
jgi:hypothetical protein